MTIWETREKREKEREREEKREREESAQRDEFESDARAIVFFFSPFVSTFNEILQWEKVKRLKAHILDDGKKSIFILSTETNTRDGHTQTFFSLSRTN